jgi:hypothetical protein
MKIDSFGPAGPWGEVERWLSRTPDMEVGRKDGKLRNGLSRRAARHTDESSRIN